MKCDPNYKNLNEIQSYSEQKYATVQWANQVCMNEEFLKQEVDLLKYLAPPTVRKWFSPILLDQSKSWGCTINDLTNEISFSGELSKEIPIDFSDFQYIDEENSDCVFESYIDDGVIKRRACVPYKIDDSTVNTSCSNHDGGEVGSYWGVGFDKSKNYEIRPEWVDDWKEATIPAIARAQTFTIPEGVNGMLESVDLRVYTQGSIYCMWGSPLYVQVWRTKDFHATVTEWDKIKKCSKMKVPVEWENIKYPEGYPWDCLATASYRPMKTAPGWINFEFDKAIEVNEGEHYALVFLSPLSHPSHQPMIGGWSRQHNKKYAGGDAFLSENNGRKWKRYGKNADNWKKVDFKLGKYTPQDFAFKCHIREYAKGRDTEEEYYLYLKPIHANPIKKVTINPLKCEGHNDSSNYLSLVFEVSTDGKKWEELEPSVILDRDDDGEFPHIVFVRARMKSTLPPGATTTDDTPSIEKMIITLEMEHPSEMYARTQVYNPKLGDILGANVWGSVYAPFRLDPNVNGSVEIIEDRECSEFFEIVSLEGLRNYVYVDSNGDLQCKFDDVDAEKISDEDVDKVYQYLTETPSVINILKENNIYVKPYIHTVNGNEVRDMLSFTEGIKLVNSPAYPLIECRINPSASSASVQSFKEWCDFKFDYDKDLLKFYYEAGGENEEDHYVIDNIPDGSLTVTYNPIFIQDLSANEVGKRSDSDEGLILDYFKETFIISDENFENNSVNLRVRAVEPLKEVILNDKELFETLDFNVDYNSNELKFNVERIKINVGDSVTVVYTPNLDAAGISIGYRGKRNSKDKDMFIEPNYIEYKV